MGLIIDTSVLVAAERGRLSLGEVLAPNLHTSVGISAITAAELLHGVHRAADPGVRMRRAASLESVLGAVPIYPFGLLEARRHAEATAYLRSRGAMIGAHDLLIAATALARGDALLTLNVRAFERVPGLSVLSAT